MKPEAVRDGHLPTRHWIGVGFRSTDRLTSVRFLQEGDDLLDVPGLSEEPSELVLTEIPKDRLHGVNMFFRPFFGADEEENRMDRLLVERVEVHTCLADADRDCELVEAGGLDMGHGDAVTESSRTLPFPLQRLLEVEGLLVRSDGVG